MKRALVLLGAAIVLGLASGCDERSDPSEAARAAVGKADGRMGWTNNHNETLLRAADVQPATDEEDRP